WHITLFWARGDDENPANFPPFDFQFFGKYLERGLWPFLVSLAASAVLVPVIMVVLFVPLFLAGVQDAQAGREPAAALFVGLFVIYSLIVMAFQFIVIPLVLRATVTQDFARAFDLRFVKRFLALIWRELFISILFMFGIGLCLMIVTVI